jgi:hypothetical protein
MAEKTPWKAAVLAIAYPGLGHLYLGRWRRALVWLVVVALFSNVPLLVISESLTPTTLSIPAFLAVARSIPLWLPAIVLAALLSNAADAYRLAESGAARSVPRDSREPSIQVRCPNCNKKQEDTDLDFCQWCAEPLDEHTTSR